MVRLLRAQGKTVAVLLIDPSSPRTGGAFLGDRIRMQGFVGDLGVYFRSAATRGALGGLAESTARVCPVIEAAGWDVLLIETVGVGQDEVAVAALADLTVLVLVPGMGDEMQALKAGVLEVADIYVVNKADLAGADRVVQDLAATEALVCAEGAPRAVLSTVATTGAGVEALLGALAGLARRPAAETLELPAARPGTATIDHLGVAVRSISAARERYALLGLEVGQEEVVEQERVRLAMVDAGGSRIELLEPLAEDSVIGRYLARHGEGLHHVALRVRGIDARFRKLEAAGVRLASERVQVGAGGHRYFFVHPGAAHGVLLELVEAAE